MYFLHKPARSGAYNTDKPLCQYGVSSRSLPSAWGGRQTRGPADNRNSHAECLQNMDSSSEKGPVYYGIWSSRARNQIQVNAVTCATAAAMHCPGQGLNLNPSAPEMPPITLHIQSGNSNNDFIYMPLYKC